jgi:hypothetical protein
MCVRQWCKTQANDAVALQRGLRLRFKRLRAKADYMESLRGAPRAEILIYLARKSYHSASIHCQYEVLTSALNFANKFLWI